MKILLAVVLMFTAALALGQTTAVSTAHLTDLYGAGGAYSPNATPVGSAIAFEAHKLNASGTWSFTEFLAVPQLPSKTAAGTPTPFTMSSNVGTGVAQKFADFGAIPIYTTGTAGISWTGQDTSWQLNYGFMPVIPLKGKMAGWYVLPFVQGMSGGSTIGGTRFEVGFAMAWGRKQ